MSITGTATAPIQTTMVLRSLLGNTIPFANQPFANYSGPVTCPANGYFSHVRSRAWLRRRQPAGLRELTTADIAHPARSRPSDHGAVPDGTPRPTPGWDA